MYQDVCKTRKPCGIGDRRHTISDKESETHMTYLWTLLDRRSTKHQKTNNLLYENKMADDNANDDDASISSGGDDDPKDGKRKERLEQNRISARESRKRKKNMIEELQRTVITLSRENKELNERNDTLRRELVEIGTKNPGVVNIQALMSCTGSASGVNDAAASTALPGEIPSGAASGNGSTNGMDNGAPSANPQAAQNQQMQNAIQQQQQALMQQMFAMNPALMGGMMGMSGMMGGMGLPQQQQQDQQQQQQAPPPANPPK